MRSRQRLWALMALLLLIVGIKVGQQVYGWVAYRDERAAIESLQGELTKMGLEVVRTTGTADSLQNVIDGMDEGLGDARGDLERYEGRVARGDRSIERAYRGELSRYNERVNERNEIYRRWSATVDENREAVDRFNEVADSIRVLAERMGEPYYPIPSPAEIANESGVFRADADAGSLR